jgi:ribosomal protein S18 acetylase RimI-like enzyme
VGSMVLAILPVSGRDARCGEVRFQAHWGGVVVGRVSLRRGDGRTGEVGDLFIDPAYRKRGLGVALLTHAARVGARMHLRSLTLTSDDHRGSGRLTAWYKRLGFVQTGVDALGRPVLEVPIGHVLSRADDCSPCDRSG